MWHRKCRKKKQFVNAKSSQSNEKWGRNQNAKQISKIWITLKFLVKVNNIENANKAKSTISAKQRRQKYYMNITGNNKYNDMNVNK